MRNGLFCCQNRAHKGGGHPWDRRSWEAEVWLMRKWWILIRREVNVVCQTRWWREIWGWGWGGEVRTFELLQMGVEGNRNEL
jgi:hypothetical protein